MPPSQPAPIEIGGGPPRRDVRRVCPSDSPAIPSASDRNTPPKPILRYDAVQTDDVLPDRRNRPRTDQLRAILEYSAPPRARAIIEECGTAQNCSGGPKLNARGREAMRPLPGRVRSPSRAAAPELADPFHQLLEPGSSAPSLTPPRGLNARPHARCATNHHHRQLRPLNPLAGDATPQPRHSGS